MIYEYNYRIRVENLTNDITTGVEASLTGVPSGWKIINGKVLIGTISAGATVTSPGLITLRVDLMSSHVPTLADLTWSLTPVGNTIQQVEALRPAEIAQIALADLGFPNGADEVEVSGSISEAIIKDGYVYLSTPGDNGYNQTAQLSIKKDGMTKNFLVPIFTMRHLLPISNYEGSDEGGLDVSPKLQVSGLGPDNNFTGQPLVFKLIDVPLLELGKESDATIRDEKLKGIDYLSDYWTFDPSENSFTIAGDNLKRLLANLPSGELNININFVASNANFGANFDLMAIAKGIVVKGRLVTPNGQLASELAGRKIHLRGYGNSVRKVANVDQNGNFSFENITPDTYFIALSDLNSPDFVSTHFTIDPNSTDVEVELLYETTENIGSKGKARTPRLLSAKESISGTRQNGNSDKRGEILSQPPLQKQFEPWEDYTEDYTWYYVDTLQDDKKFAAQNFYHPIPPGAKKVRIRATIFTNEYTGEGPHKDSWSYLITGLPTGVLAESGVVDKSHAGKEEISREWCIDVSKLTINQYHDLYGRIAVNNVGSRYSNTWIFIEFDTGCGGRSGPLDITSAKFKSPNKDNNHVLKPLGKGSATGPYLSIPLTAPLTKHTLPLEIMYEPVDAKIKEVNISVAAGDNLAFSSDNLLSQNHSIQNGKIIFPGISLPAFPSAQTDEKITVRIRLKGIVNGEETESDQEKQGVVDFSGNRQFVPLFLANDQSGLGARRYGGRDAGGDSWATMQTIRWLQTNEYRFNDISAQHVAQFSNGRSVLDHEGHSNGQQIDMRYADGQKGYSDNLGGADDGNHIKALIKAARVEVESDTKDKPNLVLLQAWIKDNRTMIWNELDRPDSELAHIGLDFIKDAIIHGKFSGKPELMIPGIEPVKPHPNLKPVGGHLHHWHVNKSFNR